MKQKRFAFVFEVLFFLLPASVALADDPTSKFINPGPIFTVLAGPASGVAVNVELWNAAVGGTILATESHSVDVDASGNLTNDTGFGDLELGRGSGGVDGSLFQNTAVSFISRYLDVTQSGVSVLPGYRIPFLTVAFALSTPLIHNFGTQNLFAGVGAGNLSLTGQANTGVGFGALSSDTTGTINTAVGVNALGDNTTGSANTAVGENALRRNTTGGGNVATGIIALEDNTGTFNTATGAGALARNTTGSSNTATGNSALAGNTAGNDNIAMGVSALEQNTTGNENIATGNFAMEVNTTGNANTASGSRALLRNTTGNENTATGRYALLSNTTANYNTATGSSALRGNTAGNENTATGRYALVNNTTGNSNTAHGLSALFTNFTGSNNTAIGSGADVVSDGLTNATAIGYGAVATASNMVRVGNRGVTVIQGQVGFTASSDRNEKENFQAVNGEEVLTRIRGLSLTSWNFIGHDPKRFRHYGPVAQDFFAAFGHDGVGTIGTPTTITSTDIDGILMIASQALEKRTAAQEAHTADQQREIDALRARLESLERLMADRAER